MGVLAGLLVSVGTVVLLQQYSEVYPTRTVTVAGLVIGLVIGLTAPSIIRVYNVRANRLIGGAPRRLNATMGSRAGTTGPPAGSGEDVGHSSG